MAKCVAFLRAINVGGHVVKMDRLKKLFEEAGFKNVETFIASGNVIFDSSAKTDSLEKKIETMLKKALGYEVSTFVRTVPELQRIADVKPFPDCDAGGNTLYVGFLAAPKKSLDVSSKRDAVAIDDREVYWLSRGPMLESDLSGAIFEKKLACPATFRNINTIRRIAAKYAS
jgi:uncharacterized protein (DUF1697 family)